MIKNDQPFFILIYILELIKLKILNNNIKSFIFFIIINTVFC